jgi:hypothetical protein
VHDAVEISIGADDKAILIDAQRLDEGRAAGAVRLLANATVPRLPPGDGVPITNALLVVTALLPDPVVSS